MRIDVDTLFDKYLDEFIEKNIDEYTPSQLEKMVEKLYEEFGNKPNLVLCGLSPIEYYRKKTTEELLSEFLDSFEEGSSACEFLCRELQNRKDAEDELVEFSQSENTEIATCSVNILGETGSKKALENFVNAVVHERVKDELFEAMIEALVKGADLVKEDLLKIYDGNKPSHKALLEVFSSMSKDERVYQILYCEYLRRRENREEIYGFLGKYGDERILGHLYGEVESRELSPIELEEIKLAIEKLGGNVDDLKVKICH